MFDFERSEQREIRESVKKLAEKELPKYQTEAFFNTVPRDLFKAFADIGITGIAIEEAYGGINSSPTSCMIVMEEVAAVDLGPAIFVSVHSMVSGLIGKFGTPQQKSKYLPLMSKGAALGAFALTEPGAGSDAAALTTEAKPKDGGFVINGEKCYITSAGFADIYLVFARTLPVSTTTTAAGDQDSKKKGISCFIVEGASAGLNSQKPEKKMGCELSPIASLTFRDLFVPKENLLGSIHDGYRIALGGLANGRINIAGCANGLSRSAIEFSVAHLKERKQFGKALAEFQALQFMLADMQMKFEAALLLAWQAAKTLEETPTSMENRLYPSLAKCFASDAAMSITTDAVQLLGGAGYIREYKVERLMRDAKMLQIVEGTNQIQRLVIAREMLR